VWEGGRTHLSTVKMAMKVAQKLTQLVIMLDIRDARTPMPITWNICGAVHAHRRCQQLASLLSQTLICSCDQLSYITLSLGNQQ
jgi:hypothetical protein